MWAFEFVIEHEHSDVDVLFYKQLYCSCGNIVLLNSDFPVDHCKNFTYEKELKIV